jgi:hypothetical protein
MRPPFQFTSLACRTEIKGSGQAVVTLDGRDFYLGPSGSVASRAEYDRLIGEWMANGRAPPPAGAAPGGRVDIPRPTRAA